MSWAGTSVKMDPDRPDSRSDFHTTPSLERHAREGMHYTDACAPHPNCSPTRLAIQTRKIPSQLNMSDIINRNSGRFYEGLPMVPPRHINHMPPEETTIAELLKQHVRTARRSSWAANRVQGRAQGSQCRSPSGAFLQVPLARTGRGQARRRSPEETVLTIGPLPKFLKSAAHAETPCEQHRIKPERKAECEPLNANASKPKPSLVTP